MVWKLQSKRTSYVSTVLCWENIFYRSRDKEQYNYISFNIHHIPMLCRYLCSIMLYDALNRNHHPNSLPISSPTESPSLSVYCTDKSQRSAPLVQSLNGQIDISEGSVPLCTYLSLFSPSPLPPPSNLNTCLCWRAHSQQIYGYTLWDTWAAGRKREHEREG